MGTTNKDIVDTAMSFIGKVKYVFGGNNIAGGYGDCSDFTQYVYNCYGIDIGGNTETQYGQGVSVAKEDIKAGDLVFFKGTYDSGYRDGVSHVGIAIGNNKFVHNSSSKGVTVSDLGSTYYTDHYLDARRLSSITYLAPYMGASEDSYKGLSGSEGSGGSEGSSGSKGSLLGLTWWGDVVKVVVCIIILVAGVALLAGSVGTQIFKKGGLINGIKTGN